MYIFYSESQPMWFAKSGIVWHIGCYQWVTQDEATGEWYTETDVHTSIIGKMITKLNCS